jgi:16S rRNA (guanine527-N7)-methyltransferase
LSGAGFEASIAARAAVAGIQLPHAAIRALAGHASAVLAANPLLHLTTVTDPVELVERHIGESFEGAALLEPGIEGVLVDLGSGNGYPGLPLAAARPGLRAVLIEASRKKARFLGEVIEIDWFAGAVVLERQVQRGADLDEVSPVRVLTARAVGSWEKILPRLVGALDVDARVLLWAGEAVESVRQRPTWRNLELDGRHALPGRERSWIWVFKKR